MNSNLARPPRLILLIVRLLTFFTLGVLLLSPQLKREEEQLDKPILVWLTDQSQSMIAGGDSTAVRQFKKDYASRLNALKQKYQQTSLSFTTKLSEPTDSFSIAGTDLQASLEELQDRYYKRNLAGVVLLSDGIYNLGSDPSYLAERLAFPVYSVFVGDSTKRRDLMLERLVHNKISYLNNDFPVEVYIRARAMQGESYRVKIIDPDGKLVVDESFDINSSDYFRRKSYFLKAQAEGFQRYTVILEGENADESVENNRSVFSVEVLSNRKQILLLASAPHPDLAAISNAIGSAERYELTTQINQKLPEEKDYDLIILHQPSSQTLQSVSQTNIPYWLFLGPNTRTQDFEPLKAGNKGYEESQVYINNKFDLFTLGDKELALVGDLPPIWAPFGTPEISGKFYPLLFKQVGAIKTMDPAWLYRYDYNSSGSERRSCIVLGTGIWRWRMQDYRINESFDAFDQIILQSTQFLTTHARTDRFDVNIANRFQRSERIIGEARLYNSNLELNNDPEASITFYSEDGKEYDFSLNRTGNTYRVNAGTLPPGVYHWRASTNLGDENFEDSGKLLIESEIRELTDLVARPSIMRKMAEASGGMFFKIDEASALQEALLSNSNAKSYRSIISKTTSLIEAKWLFVLLLCLMALEWGLRKYFGRY